MNYNRGPQPPGHRPAAVRGLLGTGPHSRRWAASEAPSVFTAAPHRSYYCLSSAFCQHHGELYNYFIIYYNAIIIEIKCTINVMCLNHSETIPSPLSPVRGKIVFHETGPWCHKCWAPLNYKILASPKILDYYNFNVRIAHWQLLICRQWKTIHQSKDYWRALLSASTGLSGLHNVQ